MSNQNTTPTVAATIHALVQHLVHEANQTEREVTAAFNAEYPDQEPEEPELCTLVDVMEAFASDDTSGYGAASAIARDIKDAVLHGVNAVAPIDPWPSLTRKELRFLVSGRRIPSGTSLYGAISDMHLEDEPLTLMEKFAAAGHRVWLESGADKRRAKLAKAKATIAALEGRAA